MGGSRAAFTIGSISDGEGGGSKKYMSKLLIALVAYKQAMQSVSVYSKIMNFKHKNHWQPTHLASNLDELTVPPNLSQK